MNRYIKLALSPLYWAFMNRLRNHRVESWSVGFRAKIGKKVVIRAGSEVGSGVEIGDYSYISGPRAYVEAARIGKFCSIARQTTIGVSGHDHQLVTTHPFILDPGYGIARLPKAERQKPPPVIGHDVWIGMNSIVHRGVTIGTGAVIAADAVVTKDVAPYPIVGGNPAHHLKFRFPADVVEVLLASAWWDWTDEKLASAVEDFSNLELSVARHCATADGRTQANEGVTKNVV